MARAPRVPSTVVKARLNLRIEQDLVAWVKDYAERKNTTVTRILTGHLRRLRRREGKKDAVRQF